MSKVALIGLGAMGMNVALRLAEQGLHVAVYDLSKEKRKEAQKVDSELGKKFIPCETLQELVDAVKDEKQRIILLETNHGKPIDDVISELEPNLKSGDILIDCGNEWYIDTERRMDHLAKKCGAHWLGLGVSGGYQSARRGARMVLGGNREICEKVMPLLEKLAASSPKGLCLLYTGPGGSGHYVKMVHNGIEQGMMTSHAEVYGIMKIILKMSNDEISETFKKWNEMENNNNFLTRISVDICKRKDEKGWLVDQIRDKVVQDASGSEGTGVWSVKEAADRHVPCPTIATAHFLRITSAYRNDRVALSKKMSLNDHPSDLNLNKEEILTKLRDAFNLSMFCSFIQGCNLIAKASHDQKWKISMVKVMDVWRASCIIEWNRILDLLQGAYSRMQKEREEPPLNVLLDDKVIDEVRKTYSSLKSVVKLAVDWDSVPIPALSGSLNYVKSYFNDELSTHQLYRSSVGLFWVAPL